jgi:hypothetical protein
MSTGFLDFDQFKAIESLAEETLGRYGVLIGPPVPVRKIAEEALGLRCENRVFSHRDKGKRCQAALSPDDRKILIDPRWDPRQLNFAVAHEIGHWRLHQNHQAPKVKADAPDGIPLVGFLKSRKYKMNKAKRDNSREREAECFAGALLMERSLLLSAARRYKLIDEQALSELATLFDVSISAMLTRIKYLAKHRGWNGPSIDETSLGNLAEKIDDEEKAQRRSAILYLLAKKLSELDVDFTVSRSPSLQSRLPTRRRPLHRPLIIELAGLPNAGKDKISRVLVSYLEDVKGYRVGRIEESFGSCTLTGSKLDKFKWAILNMVNKLQEYADMPEKYDVVLVNRGLFDALAWLQWWRQWDKKFTEGDQHEFESLLLHSQWRDLVDYVFLLRVSPAESIRREYSEDGDAREVVDYLARKYDKGSAIRIPTFANEEALRLLNESYEYALCSYKQLFRSYPVESMDVRQAADDIMKVVHPRLPHRKRSPNGAKVNHKAADSMAQLLLPGLEAMTSMHQTIES